jgi:ketosteroid isomerase-like protein
MPTPVEQTNLNTLEAYFDATNRGDVAGMMALTTPNTVFENTYPPPDGELIIGQAAVGAFFQNLFDNNQSTRETMEHVIPANDYCTVRWRYEWVDGNGTPGHVRGVAIFRFEEGKIAEQLNYVKG